MIEKMPAVSFSTRKGYHRCVPRALRNITTDCPPHLDTSLKFLEFPKNYQNLLKMT